MQNIIYATSERFLLFTTSNERFESVYANAERKSKQKNLDRNDIDCPGINELNRRIIRGGGGGYQPSRWAFTRLRTVFGKNAASETERTPSLWKPEEVQPENALFKITHLQDFTVSSWFCRAGGRISVHAGWNFRFSEETAYGALRI